MTYVSFDAHEMTTYRSCDAYERTAGYCDEGTTNVMHMKGRPMVPVMDTKGRYMRHMMHMKGRLLVPVKLPLVHMKGRPIGSCDA